MNSPVQGYISAQLAIVLAVILGSVGILYLEWRSAHPAKHHHAASSEHHHYATSTVAN